jgi:putative toxin-antitoxin system antitoxin component (TIGR02293 family)
MSIFELSEKSDTEQIAAIEKGLPSYSLNQIAKMLGVPKQKIIAGLKLAQRTISEREREKKRFNLEESERLLRVLRVHRLAREVFTTDEAVAEWLSAPDRSLGMRTPLAMLATDIGTAMVENLANAMMHGVPV